MKPTPLEQELDRKIQYIQKMPKELEPLKEEYQAVKPKMNMWGRLKKLLTR